MRGLVGQSCGHQYVRTVARHYDKAVALYFFQEIRRLHGAYERVFHYVAQVIVSKQHPRSYRAAYLVYGRAVQAFVGRYGRCKYRVVFDGYRYVLAYFLRIFRRLVGNDGYNVNVLFAELFVYYADVGYEFFFGQFILRFYQHGRYAQVASYFEVEFEFDYRAFGIKVRTVHQYIIEFLLQGLVV